jgi:hypothetical protein
MFVMVFQSAFRVDRISRGFARTELIKTGIQTPHLNSTVGDLPYRGLFNVVFPELGKM